MVLLYPAVFLSLGENFLEFGFDPPGQEPGVAIAWIVCGVLFMAIVVNLAAILSGLYLGYLLFFKITS